MARVERLQIFVMLVMLFGASEVVAQTTVSLSKEGDVKTLPNSDKVELYHLSYFPTLPTTFGLIFTDHKGTQTATSGPGTWYLSGRIVQVDLDGDVVKLTIGKAMKPPKTLDEMESLTAIFEAAKRQKLAFASYTTDKITYENRIAFELTRLNSKVHRGFVDQLTGEVTFTAKNTKPDKAMVRLSATKVRIDVISARSTAAPIRSYAQTFRLCGRYGDPSLKRLFFAEKGVAYSAKAKKRKAFNKAKIRKHEVDKRRISHREGCFRSVARAIASKVPNYEAIAEFERIEEDWVMYVPMPGKFVGGTKKKRELLKKYSTGKEAAAP